MSSSIKAIANGHALSRDLSPSLLRIADLKILGRELRRHPKRQIDKLKQSLDEFGFVLPILIDAQRRVIAGTALILAAQQLGLREIPAVTVSDLSEAKTRALRLALNRIADDASWDDTALKLEFAEILELDPQVDLEITGFETAEIDNFLILPGDEEDDMPPDETIVAVSGIGDMWVLGEHRILCGDARSNASYEDLLGDDRAQMVFTDPPYNVCIDGHVSGNGTVKHAEFAMASGEMSSDQFSDFLKSVMRPMAAYSANGSIHFVCMDWRHISELLRSIDGVLQVKNLCIWNKSNAGMGSLYRSKHELIFVLKNGRAPHINNIQLGRYGRNRANVWDYAGQNAVRGQKNKLALHPTVKPVAMVADAIRDCSTLNGIVLDPFGGLGTTLIAAERSGRRARVIEIEPRYVDATVRRWQYLTGRTAHNAKTKQSFADRAAPPWIEAPARREGDPT